MSSTTGADTPLPAALSLRGYGDALPEAVEVSALVGAEALARARYANWPRVRRAGPSLLPSELALGALRAALADAAVAPEEVALLVACAPIRDRPPPWSLSTQLLGALGLPPTAVGLDLDVGCVGLAAALELAQGWLSARGGLGLLVAAERVTSEVALLAPEADRLWHWSDGAAAIVVGEGQGEGARYVTSAFRTLAAYNDLVIRPHGGAASPVASVNHFEVKAVNRTSLAVGISREVKATVAQLRARTGVEAFDWVVASQTGPLAIDFFATVGGVARERVVVTGAEHGHVGGADLVLGLAELKRRGAKGQVLLISIASPTFAASLVRLD